MKNKSGKLDEFIREIWRRLWLTDQTSAQVLVGLVTILASASVGLYYYENAFIKTFLIFFWLCCVALCFLVLFPVLRSISIRPDRIWLALIALFLVALFLRLVNLQNLPPGFHVDEAGTAEFTLLHVLNPSRPDTLNPFITGSDSQPTLYYYFLHFSMTLAGYSIWGARFSSAVVGALSVLAVYFLINEMVGKRIAWLTVILMTVYHYQIHWSRIALNNIWATLFPPLTLACFLWGWRNRYAGGAVLAGLFLGLTAYFYAGGYVVIFLMLLLIVRTWRKTAERIDLSIYLGKMFTMTLVIVAPLIVYAMLKPALFFERSHIVNAWKPDVIEMTVGKSDAYWAFFWHQLTSSFSAYNFSVDMSGYYAPRIPFLIGVASVLFLVGIGVTLFKKQYFPVLWVIIVTLTGGFMVVGAPATSHYIAVIPAICWSVAISLDWLIENKRSALAYIFLIAIIVTDLYFYFVVYQTTPSGDLILPFPDVPLLN